MDTRSTRSRSKTPFNPVELTSGFIENESHVEKASVRTTRRTTTFRTRETSSGEVSSMTERPVRRSARSERISSKWYKTSDYSSEDGENEVSSTRTISQNEKNQLVEDARAAANGNSEVSALNLYKKSGRYWDVYPKTDWTYSPHSKDRIELAPGVVAMPNMSRKTIHSLHSHSTEGSFDYAHKETNTETFSRRSEADYLPRQLFNNNEYKSSYKKMGFVRRQWARVVSTWVTIFATVVAIFRSLFRVQTTWFAKLHTFTSRVMLLDTWLLWKNGAGNKTARLVALCLVPLVLLGGVHVLLVSGVSLAPSCHPNCRHTASAYLNSLISDTYKLFNVTDPLSVTS